MRFKAPTRPQARRDLIEVTLEDWDADLDHILGAHSDPLDTVKVAYADRVVPL